MARLENAICTQSEISLQDFLVQERIDSELLSAAIQIKRASAQIDEIVHAIGILLALPEILEFGERIISVSLAAGNTGKASDLITDKRIAEFTFIDWKGGSESIRKQKLFKDFYLLAETDTSKKRYLYFLGAEHPQKVFESRSPGTGMLRKFSGLQQQFASKYGPAMTAKQYYELHKHLVELRNLQVDAPNATASFQKLTTA